MGGDTPEGTAGDTAGGTAGDAGRGGGRVRAGPGRGPSPRGRRTRGRLPLAAGIPAVRSRWRSIPWRDGLRCAHGARGAGARVWVRRLGLGRGLGLEPGLGLGLGLVFGLGLGLVLGLGLGLGLGFRLGRGGGGWGWN